MPALKPPGQVIRVEFKTNDDASILAGSRFFLSYTGAEPGSGDLNTLSTDVSAAWGSHIAPLVITTEHLVDIISTDLSSDTGAIGQWTGSIAGTTGGASLPANACAVVNHGIARRYRGGRPRTYLRCGTAGTLNGTNEWTTTFQGQVLAGWEAFIAEVLALTGFGFTIQAIVNVSWYSGNTVFTTPTGRARNIPVARTTPIVDDITGSSVALKVGSQRRRLDI
jgi:hypothetical protein